MQPVDLEGAVVGLSYYPGRLAFNPSDTTPGILIEREPTNQHDRNALRVSVVLGGGLGGGDGARPPQLGYVAAEFAARFARAMATLPFGHPPIIFQQSVALPPEQSYHLSFRSRVLVTAAARAGFVAALQSPQAVPRDLRSLFPLDPRSLAQLARIEQHAGDKAISLSVMAAMAGARAVYGEPAVLKELTAIADVLDIAQENERERESVLQGREVQTSELDPILHTNLSVYLEKTALPRFADFAALDLPAAVVAKRAQCEQRIGASLQSPTMTWLLERFNHLYGTPTFLLRMEEATATQEQYQTPPNKPAGHFYRYVRDVDIYPWVRRTHDRRVADETARRRQEEADETARRQEEADDAWWAVLGAMPESELRGVAAA